MYVFVGGGGVAVKFYADEPAYDNKIFLQSFLLFSNVRSLF